MNDDIDPELAESLALEVATTSEGKLDDNSPKDHDVELTLREIRAVQLRAAGAGFDQIATALGYANRSGAYKAVRRALQRWGSEAVEELRVLELARLDQITQKLWPQILGAPAKDNGDGTQAPPREPDQKAMDLYLKVSGRRAKLLGLDMPITLDLTAEGLNPEGERVVADFNQFVGLVQQIAEMQAEDGEHSDGEGDAPSEGGGDGAEVAEHSVLPSHADD